MGHSKILKINGSMKISGPKKIIAFAMALLIWILPRLAVADDEIMNEYLVKAAFAYNFAKFVEWPPCSGDQCNDHKLVIGLYGWGALGDKVIDAFNSIKGKTVGKKVISVKYVNDPAELHTCQMVYSFSSKQKNGKSLMGSLKGYPILTVSDEEDFIYSGGMIELIKMGAKLRFSINRRAAKEASIQISSQLLKLAREVVE